MSRKEIFNKENIAIEGAKFVRKNGIEKLNTRELAKYIGCSTQPIYRSYKNMKEYKKSLEIELRKYYKNFIDEIIDKKNYLLTISYAYALFAKKESNIFRALFITDLAGSRTVQEVIDTNRNRGAIESATEQYNMKIEEAEELFRDVRFYTHGIATQLCCQSIILKDEEIYKLIKNAINKFIN